MGPMVAIYLTSVLINIKLSLSHIALFALNSVCDDFNVAVLIYFCLYLFNDVHPNWPSVFLRHDF